MKRIRKSKVTKEEILSDLIFLLASAIISFLAVFLFDIHHSFYNWPIKIDFIFTNAYPYLIFIPIGAIIGLLIIKLILFGVKEENIDKSHKNL